ncbi:methyltransferase family protein [Knoellia sp. Soil729]|uniref:methyltransferase family protein n=1 Tax=Knoellia sp. Soil729 TaxID=1736394 RepID=UPI0006FFC1C1|nr:isoprenylcysteine carboxylmethyltransferase family protein [Knoellia sp. Soil729]KRE42781.1 hypothetical protein ASG74_10420 [Knoellia sp. Soil729]
MPHVPPPAIALVAAIAQHALAPQRSTASWRRLPAAAVALGSVALPTATLRRFLDAGTTLDPSHPTKASTLVTDGPNALTRNPMYLGLAGLLSAHALARGGWTPWLPVAGFVLVVDRFQVRPEEEALRARFGEAYDAYCSRVRRWV